MAPERFELEKMSFIKKNFIQFIYKEKSGAITKLKLVQDKRNHKFKKNNQVYFVTLVLASYGSCGDNA